MANLLTRRLALFRIASVAGASAVASAPLALAAVQPKTPENPELLAAGQRLITEAEECVRLESIRAEARAAVMSSWPKVPSALCRRSDVIGSDNEEDCDGKPLNRGGAYNLSRYDHYHGTRHLNERMAELPQRGGTRKEKRERQAIKRMLPIAADYDEARNAAMDAHDYRAKASAHEDMNWRVQETLRQVGSLPAFTPAGITIKAQAYQACVALGKEGKFQAAIRLGPMLAEDICRVLNDDDGSLAGAV